MGSVELGNPGDGDIDFTDFIPGWIVDNAGFGKAENALKCADGLWWHFRKPSGVIDGRAG